MTKPNLKRGDFSKSGNKTAVKSIRTEKNGERNTTADLKRELNIHKIKLEIQNEELLETQAKLAASLKEYTELFEQSPIAYFILDKNGVIEKVNERGAVQMGIDKADLRGKQFSTYLNGEPHLDNFYRHRIQVIEKEKTQRVECEIKRNDGVVFSAMIKSAVVKDEQHRFKHFLLMVGDISHIKQHEQLVEQSLIKAQELNLMKSRFITTASHEFRTPLTSVLSSISLMEQYIRMGEVEKVKRHIARVKLSVKDLTNILDDFLSLEKFESGKVEIKRKAFNLPEFCQDVMEDVSGLLKKEQHITYKNTGDPEITEDRKILHHVLMNLLSNASKYSEEGSEIQLYTDADMNKVSIRVTDTGIGIPEEEQKDIFRRFFRAQNAETIQGAGLGLNIVKRYLELLNGTISFSSRENEGASFVVELPKH